MGSTGDRVGSGRWAKLQTGSSRWDQEDNRLGGCLVTGTQDLMGNGSPTADLLAQCLMAYRQNAGLMPVNGPLIELDWGELWAHYSQLLQHHPSVIILYPGSLGDRISEQLTVADWARDWRMPLILTLPVGEAAIPQAAAYRALADRAKAKLLGWVLFHEGDRPQPDPADLPAQIQILTGIPVLGGLPKPILEQAEAQELARWGATLDWERMRW